MNRKAGFGGGCHWCTEAVFSSLKGVAKVGQGWIASEGENTGFSEGVVVEYDPDMIPFEVLIAVHLHTHSCTALHSMRGKYRSAVYTFNEADTAEAKAAITALQAEFDRLIITKVLPFSDFKLNKEEQLNYYYTNPSRPFCKNYINPKLQLLREKFSTSILEY
jgi:peptide-methionine (S)-S-oxide reductase